MKKYIITFSIMLLSNLVNSQNKLSKLDDVSRISISTLIPDQVEGLPEIARQQLATKIDEIVTIDGLGGENSRFVIMPIINVLGKEITSTTPSMTALSLNITLIIGDGIEGTKFATTSSNVKGVGINETKAYISALKNINTNNQLYKIFIEKAKVKIIEYYNSKCDFLIKESQTLASQNKFDEAIANLMQVPDVCKDCYIKSLDAVIPIFKTKIDKECKIQISKAKAIWASGQNLESASQISEIFNQIDPASSCYFEVQNLTKEISKRVKEIDQREWNFKLKEQQDEVDIRKLSINAAKEIGIAYAKNRPRVVYNTRIVRGIW